MQWGVRTNLIGLVAVFCVVVTAAAAVAQLPPGGTFTDDDGNIFEPSIEAIAAEGITKGCNPPQNDEFCPFGLVTRGEMAAFIVRARDLTYDGPLDYFTDDDGTTFEADINTLAHAGITFGCNPPDNDEFCPTQRIPRRQMAAFLVRAYGYTDAGAGDLFIDDDGTIFETDIDKLAVAGVTKGCNPPANDRFCPDQFVTRGQMAAFLQRAEGLDPIVPPPPEQLTLTPVATDLSQPVHVTAPEGDDRLFIVEKGGTIRILENGAVLPTPFLDISALVFNGGERGLLSMAFHPEYASNGRFFVYYSEESTSILAEYTVSADPDVADDSGTIILEVAQPATNHNGGLIEFGPDGYLWLGLGDGGGGNDPGDNAHTITNLLGSMLRLDVGTPGTYDVPPGNPFVGVEGRDEIWAYGLRNPWRFAFDGNELYIGDVGQGAIEEIDVVDVTTAAATDFGWRTFEGSSCTGNDPTCSTAGLTFPVLEYPHPDGSSVTGGRVYRGTDPGMHRLVGHYFYGDFGAGWIRSFRHADGAALEQQDWTSVIGTVPLLASFGEDAAGKLYAVSLGGTVYRFDAE